MEHVKIDKVLSALDKASGSLYVYDPIAAHNLVLARNDVDALLKRLQARVDELEDTVNLDEMRSQWKQVCNNLDVHPEDPDKAIRISELFGKLRANLSELLGL